MGIGKIRQGKRHRLTPGQMDSEEREGTAVWNGSSRAQRNVPIWGSQCTAQTAQEGSSSLDEDGSPSGTSLIVWAKTGCAVVAGAGHVKQYRSRPAAWHNSYCGRRGTGPKLFGNHGSRSAAAGRSVSGGA